jgi:class 3 adenylate cyclase
MIRIVTVLLIAMVIHLSLGSAGVLWAESTIVQTGHYEDSTNQKTANQVQQLLIPKIKKTFYYTSSTIWSQHSIPNFSEDSSYIVLKSPLVRSVSAYINGKKLTPIKQFPFITFKIKQEQAAHPLLLKLESNTIIGLNLYLSNEREQQDHSTLASTIMLLYAGSILTLLTLLLIYGTKSKSRVFINYSVVLFFFHLTAIQAAFGFPFKAIEFLLPHFSWPLLFAPNLGVITTILFVESITRATKRKFIAYYRYISLTLSGLIVLISPFYHEHYITRVSMVAIYIGLIYAITRVSFHMEKNSDLKHYPFAFLAISSGFIVFTLQYAGLISSYEFRYMIFLGASFDVAIVLYMIYRQYERKLHLTQYLTYSLAGIVPDEDIQGIASRKQELRLETSKQEITIIFIDIAQFSKIMDDLDDEARIIAPLKIFYSTVSKIIREHSGITNKSMGDGLIGYFGYDIFGNSSGSHAQNAIDCGVAIQQEICRQIISKELEIPLVPRIGINSGEAIVGNTSDTRIDYNIIGKSVNFTSRLEAACSHFKILISNETAMRANMTKYTYHKKQVVIKHYDHPIETFEVDPFPETYVKKLEEGIKRYREFNAIYRSDEERHLLPNSVFLKVNMPIEEVVQALDFSENGMKLKLSVDLAKGIVLHCSYGDINFFSTVSWSQKVGDEYLIGIIHNYSSSEVRKELFQAFCEIKTNTDISLCS